MRPQSLRMGPNCSIHAQTALPTGQPRQVAGVKVGLGLRPTVSADGKRLAGDDGRPAVPARKRVEGAIKRNQSRAHLRRTGQ